MNFLYTTAPKAYDFSGTSTHVLNMGTYHGKTVRLVRIHEEGATPERLGYLIDYQKGRYHSGLNPTWTYVEWQQERVANGPYGFTPAE